MKLADVIRYLHPPAVLFFHVRVGALACSTHLKGYAACPDLLKELEADDAFVLELRIVYESMKKRQKQKKGQKGLKQRKRRKRRKQHKN